MSDELKKKADSLDWIKGPGTEESENISGESVSGDIVLAGSLCIAEAETMHQTFSNVLNAEVDISIESEDLSRVDAAGVQLLYALVKEAKQRSVALKWVSVSDELKEATTMLGLNQSMGFEG